MCMCICVYDIVWMDGRTLAQRGSVLHTRGRCRYGPGRFVASPPGGVVGLATPN